MLVCRAQELSPSAHPLQSVFLNSNPDNGLSRCLTHSVIVHRHRNHRFLLRGLSLLSSYAPLALQRKNRRLSLISPLSASPASSTLVEQLANETDSGMFPENSDLSEHSQAEVFNFDESFKSTDLKPLKSPPLEVKELDELPEQWRRSKLAWLCKELPAHKAATLTRILNAQRKWIRQEDATYVAVHCMRIRENETGFRVYKWMTQQHWFRFDFVLATKLADYLGKERKFIKCREIFDDIINQGRVPSESTFHILTVAYLSSQDKGCLQEACSIYNRMIQLGGYKPPLNLHNSLFRALVSKTGGSSKHYLKQAEFIYHNLATSGLEIHKDIYGGLIWLHSYQDTIDKERIASLRAEMQREGIEESQEVLISVLRVCAIEGNAEEAERTWLKLVSYDSFLPSRAFVYKLEVYANVGQPHKSLEIFKGMQEQLGTTSVVVYQKIIEILCNAQETELAESLMTEFVGSGLKVLMPSFIDLMNMFLSLDLHNKVESTFLWSMEKCRPNRTIYNIYLASLVKIGNVGKAEEIFGQMLNTGEVGVNSQSCNFLLSGYLSSGEYAKAEKMNDLMCQKKYDIEPSSREKLDYVLSLNRKFVEKPIILKLTQEQREILLGLLLGGLRIESDEERKNHAVHFEFNENLETHIALKRHIHDQFHEWLASSSKPRDGNEDIPYLFRTISHSSFAFYAEQFWPRGRPAIPKLIHRWLSPRVLAYWYMYGGYRMSSGGMLLKLKGSQEGLERVVKGLKANSLGCNVKRKGRVYWIGMLGTNSACFWKMIEPYVLVDLRDILQVGEKSLDGISTTRDINFDSQPELDGALSDYIDHDS